MRILNLVHLHYVAVAIEAKKSWNPRVSIGVSGSVSLSWQSDDPEKCDFVNYGVSRDDLNGRVHAGRSCGLYKGDYLLHANLGKLEDSVIYSYRIDCSDSVFTFKAPPSKESSTKFSLGVFADLGPINGEDTINRLSKLPVQGYIFAGDIGYADDAFMHASSYISRINDFLDKVSPMASRVPMMVVPGNHEAEDHTPVCLLSPACRRGYGNFTAFNCVWENPSHNDRHHNMWYSFDYGPIHFVMTNTETDYEGAPLEPYGEVGFIPTGKFGLPGEYEEWLQNDLQSAPPDSFVVVVGHRPISVMDDKTDPFRTPINQNIIALINKYADVYISGHVHYYTRSIPKSSNLTTLITVGGAGCDEWPERTIQDTRSGETSLYNYFAYGEEQTVGVLKYDNLFPNQLDFEIVRSRDGSIVETVTVNKRSSQESPYIHPHIVVE